MGNTTNFSDIEKKYGQKGIDYVAGKYQERKIYETIGDEVSRLNTRANSQQQEDIEFLSRQRRRLELALQEAKNEVEAKKKGAIQEAESKHKQKIEQFSGYNEKKTWLQNIQKQVRNKYATEKVRMQEKVRDAVNRHKSGNSTLNKIPEYDRHPENYRRSIEQECLKKYPSKSSSMDATELEKKLTWENYKQNFVGILNRDQIKKEVDNACSDVKKNITGGSAPLCC